MPMQWQLREAPRVPTSEWLPEVNAISRGPRRKDKAKPPLNKVCKDSLR